MLQEVPKRVEIAFDKWLAGDSNGKKSGRPRFKAIGQYKTFTYPQFKQHHFSGNKITLSKIGDVKVIVHRQIPEGFEIKTVSITQKSKGYYVTLSLDDKTVSTIKRDFNPDNRVEGENTRLRHYLARLKRKTLCYSKCEKMLGIQLNY